MFRQRYILLKMKAKRILAIAYAFFYWKKFQSRKIWIVGENNGKSAQDNGFIFYRYCRENFPDKEVYFVTRIRDLHESDSNILLYDSFRHYIYSCGASVVIRTHALRDVIAGRVFNRISKTKKHVFLQHGVIGFKNIEKHYGKWKNTEDFVADLFITSSQYEKNIITREFEFADEEVIVTGLPRHDHLHNQVADNPREILLIPTWREWTRKRFSFLESNYYKNFNGLIRNKHLQNILRDNNTIINFYPHINMHMFISYFDTSNPYVNVVRSGERTVQDMIKSCSLMVTDYSSVSFEMLSLKKPVVFYQYDRQAFFAPKGSYMNLDSELFGDVAFDEGKLISLVEEYIENDFLMKDQFISLKEKYFCPKAEESCATIYSHVKALEGRETIRKRGVYEIFEHSKRIKKLWGSIRYKAWFILLQRMLYKVFLIFPMDKKLVVFESFTAKNYAGDPKYLHQYIAKTHPELKCVWVVHNKLKYREIIKDAEVVGKFSLKYFYYLARAKYLVNNSRWPSYIKKRKKAVYLQTWHGTPLKKLVFDIDDVQYAEDDYKEVFYQDSRRWDLLVAQNKYSSDIFTQAFKFDKNIIEVGYPKNDILTSATDDEIVRLKDRLRLPHDKKVILYAPTWRDDQKIGAAKYQFKLEMDLFKMRMHLGDEYVIVIKMHYLIAKKTNIARFKHFAHDFSNHEDVQELFLISDLMITDYSSVMFDYAVTEKPMLFFAYDYDNYCGDLRGLYFNYKDEMPGPVVYDTDELIKEINQLSSYRRNFGDKLAKFKARFAYLDDGKVCERTWREVLNAESK